MNQKMMIYAVLPVRFAVFLLLRLFAHALSYQFAVILVIGCHCCIIQGFVFAVNSVLLYVIQSGLAANLLLLCNGDDCDLAVHTFCLFPPMRDVPEGSWLCLNCKGNPSLTEEFKEQPGFAKKTIQSVVGRRWVRIEGDKNAMQEQCLIKWHSLSHLHDSWVCYLSLI